MKRVFVAVAVLSAVGVGGWYGFGRRAPQPTRQVSERLPSPTEVEQAPAAHQEQPDAIEGRIVRVANEPADPFVVTLYRLSSPSERPVFGEVTLSARPTRSFTAGETFRIPKPDPGLYKVVVETRRGFSGASQISVDARRRISVTIRLGTTIKGKVLELNSRKPLQGAEAVLSRQDICDVSKASADADGRFAFYGIRMTAGPSDTAGAEVYQLGLRIRGRPSVHISEDIQLALSPKRPLVDVGEVNLIDGDWKARNEGKAWGMSGLWHGKKDGHVVVTAVRPGQPAERAGITVGEELLAIDGRPVQGLGEKARSYLLMGPAGTPVAVTVRKESAPPRTIVLVRQAVSHGGEKPTEAL
jgi:hypothetical protein